MTRPGPDSGDPGRLVGVSLDEASIGRSSPDVEHERAVAIYDLIEENAFRPSGHEAVFTRSICASTATASFSISDYRTAPR